VTDGRVVGILLLGIIGTMAVVLVGGLGVTPSVTESRDAVTVEARGYRRVIPYASVESVTTRAVLDGVRRKLHAEQSGTVYAGWFDMRPYGRTLVLADARRTPFVVIHAHEGVTVVSASDSGSAIALVRRLRERIPPATAARAIR
jgi:hypothetical protein